MSEKQESKDSLVIANEVCQRITKNLQEQYAAETTLENKMTLPFWVYCLKRALLYRSIELAANAIDLYQRNALVSAATITRSLLETTALFNRLNERCVAVIKKSVSGNRCDWHFENLLLDVRKLSFGTTDERGKKSLSESEKPFRVRAMVRDLGTRFHFNANGAYSELCQMAHTNWRGCMDSFTKWNRQECSVEFIQDYHHTQANTYWYQTTLAIVLHIVEKLEAEMAGIFPKFTKVCEEFEGG